VQKETRNKPFGSGPRFSAFPASVSKVPFVWHYLNETFDMELLAGFTSASQDPLSKTVQPEIIWAIKEN